MNRQTNQWNRIESPEIHLGSYGNLVYDKGVNSKLWDKNRLFSKWYWDN